MYNEWFLRFAPEAYRTTRVQTTQLVEDALVQTRDLHNVSSMVLRSYPGVIRVLRSATAPPIARDRLAGLAGLPTGVVKSLEGDDKTPGRVPPKMATEKADFYLGQIGEIIERLADRDLFPWLQSGTTPTEIERFRAATVVADRLCGAVADPIVRNAQERRQLSAIKAWLELRGYRELRMADRVALDKMGAGTFAFRLAVPATVGSQGRKVIIPIDAVVMPLSAPGGRLPLLIEAKSAGDFTNTNKRRKEEAIKVAQLRAALGDAVQFVLFLNGYFDSGYLGYEAAEGIDWVWEHRIDDLVEFGL